MTVTRAEDAVSTGRLHVVLVVAHEAMRALIVDLLNLDGGHWVVSAVDGVAALGDDVSSHPDLVVIDTADFAGCCRRLPASFPLGRVIVIGPEPDPAYRQAALHRGAGAWLSRECVAEELCDALCSSHACECEVRPASVERLPNPPEFAMKDSDD